MNQQPPGRDDLAARLRWRRAQARAALLFERFWPAIWPALGVAGTFLVAALLDIPRQLPPWLHALALIAALGLALALLARGLRDLSVPNQAAADRRLERASGLTHRPLAALADRPAVSDEVGLALWRAHLARAARQVGRLRVGLPRPGLAALDPRALRGALLVALAAAATIAGPDAAPRLLASLQPDFSLPAQPVLATQIQAWITPPTYTRLAPVFLKPEGGPVSAPAGSRLTVNVSGVASTGAPILALGPDIEPLRALDATSFQGERDLRASGRLALRRAGQELAGWDLTVVADQPPTAAWPETPSQMPRGVQLRLPWQVADDYGVAGLRAEIRLRDRATAPALVIILPLTGGSPTTARGVSIQDLSAHPWAGLPVTATLIARDAQDQTGTSEAAQFTLPERDFQNPIARALIAVRKRLSLEPDNRVAALNGLRPLLLAPEEFAADFGGWINLSAIASALARNKNPAIVEDAQARIWELAIHLEEGGAERSQRALEMARREAREAQERAERNPESAERRAELEQKLRELNEAIQRHLEALAEQARRELNELPPEVQRLNPREIERLTREAERAAREGKLETSRERLAELEKMLEEMRQAQQQSREQQEQRNTERRQRGRQQMGAVQDMIGREGQLLDQSQRRGSAPQDPAARRPFGQPTPPTSPQQGDPGQDRQAEQRTQQALRRALGELMQQFGDLTGKIPPALNEAEQAMRDAAEALGQGRDAAAARSEQRAIDALQRGGREMAQQMARQFGQPRPGSQRGNQPGNQPGDQPGEGEDGDGEGDPFGLGLSMQEGQSGENGDRPGQPGQRNDPNNRRRQGEQRDPLGRQLGQGTSGADIGTDVRVPEEMERQRTQHLQQELRRRGGERSRTQEELDYIERLLRRF